MAGDPSQDDPGGTDTAAGETRLVRSDTGPAALLKGRYRIEKELGRGGIGVVYLARDEQLESRPVVVKVLLAHSSESTWLQKKFRDEMRALVRLDHPGVVGALDAGTTTEGAPFLVMQYVEGVNLRSSLEDGPLRVEDVLDFVRQTALALSAAHEKGVYHRDLKPENVMVQQAARGQRVIKIIDFGIATVKETSTSETRGTQIAGSVLYMAPEQLAGKPTAASDTYALAVMTYEMLTGRPPFTPASPYEMLEVLRRGVEKRPSELRPGLDPRADAVVLRSLSFRHEDRHPSPRVFAEELAQALGPATAPAARGVPAPASVRRRPIAAAAVLVMLGVVALLLQSRTSRESALSPPAQGAATLAAPAASQSALRYHLVVQRYRNGAPWREPSRMDREILFAVDDRVRLVVSAAEAGHLYVVNQGPEPRGGSASYNVLFPPVTANGGSAAIDGGRDVTIPESSWFAFDEDQGKETLWLVWAREAVAELEAVKHLANPGDRGVVRDPGQIQALTRVFDAALRSPVRKEQGDGRTVLKATGGRLVAAVTLEHR